MAKEGQPIMDSRPAGSGGVTAETLGELETLTAALDAELAALAQAVAEADRAVDKAASWAEVGLKIIDLVDRIVPLLARDSKAPASDTPGLRSQFLGAVLRVWQTPKEQRAATLTGLMQGILGGMAGVRAGGFGG